MYIVVLYVYCCIICIFQTNLVLSVAKNNFDVICLSTSWKMKIISVPSLVIFSYVKPLLCHVYFPHSADYSLYRICITSFVVIN